MIKLQRSPSTDIRRDNMHEYSYVLWLVFFSRGKKFMSFAFLAYMRDAILGNWTEPPTPIHFILKDIQPNILLLLLCAL